MQPDSSAGRGPITVWVLEDNANFRDTVQALVEREADLSCPQGFGSGEALLEYVNDHFAPDVLLVDIGLPEMSGIEVIRRLHYLSPMTQSIVLTIHEDNDVIFEAICAGASGYLVKPASTELICQAIRDVDGGGAAMTVDIARRVLNMFTQREAPKWDYQLTAKEREVLKELVDGKSKREIADELHRSVHTVDSHLRNIFTKLHVNSQAAAIAKALRERLVR